MTGKIQLAWEFLKRNSEYIECWSATTKSVKGKEIVSPKNWGLVEYSDPEITDVKEVYWDYLAANRAVYFMNEKSFFYNSSSQKINLNEKDGEFFERSSLSRNSIVWKRGNEFLELIFPKQHGHFYTEGYINFPFINNHQSIKKLLDLVNYFINDEDLKIDNNRQLEDLLKIYELKKKGESHKSIACKFNCTEEIQKKWDSDSNIRSNIRYKLKNSEKMISYKYFTLVEN